MGRNKALLPLAPGGKSMLALVIERIRTVADDVMIIANDEGRYDQFGARVVPDTFPGSGALGGIHAAIGSAVNMHCLVVACDMPFLNVSLLQRMAAEPRDYDVLAPVMPGESRQQHGGFVYQTLHAIYGKGCLKAIERRLDAGNRQVIGFYGDVLLKRMEIDELRKHDPELRSFFNANTPDALAAAMIYVNNREPSVES